MTHSDAHEPRAVDVQITGENLGRTFFLRCRTAADENLICGWGKPGQLAETAAELHLEGLGYQIEAFLSWLRGGVTDSRISKVIVSPAERQTWTDFVLLE